MMDLTLDVVDEIFAKAISARGTRASYPMQYDLPTRYATLWDEAVAGRQKVCMPTPVFVERMIRVSPETRYEPTCLIAVALHYAYVPADAYAQLGVNTHCTVARLIPILQRAGLLGRVSRAAEAALIRAQDRQDRLFPWGEAVTEGLAEGRQWSDELLKGAVNGANTFPTDR